jgi:chromosome segregation ATPase
MGNPSDHKRLALESSLEATKETLEKEEAKRSNTERACQDALGRTYNQTHMDRLQTTLDSCDQKIAKYRETIVSITVQLQSAQEESNTKEKFLQQVRQLSQHIESAGWMTQKGSGYEF